ncbi:28S ribosomal protein S31, mitochondrial-like isoform X2 [Limulus polyphemus]|uniref:Small ribosomal subunit protein mS31 n=1 Tax=Limulus polyphemus TaxID=6850 RepID=A0ABM1B7G3_LIMPO|nr:28S ribosomal protein S31, mitochondrial-like isoform X2 [Limulus polyphemus]
MASIRRWIGIKISSRRINYFSSEVKLAASYFGNNIQKRKFSEDKEQYLKQEGKEICKNNQNSKKTEENAQKKLSSLLASMKVDTLSLKMKSNIDLNLSKPKPKRKKGAMKSHIEQEKLSYEELDEQLVTAVKDVANILGGNSDETESELVQKLRVHVQQTQKACEANGSQDGGSLSKIFLGMKIDRSKPKLDPGHSLHSYPDSKMAVEISSLRTSEKSVSYDSLSVSSEFQRNMKPKSITGRVDLFASEPLNIFLTPDKKITDVSNTKILEILQKQELKMLVTQPPRNGFEEMIQLTEQGKLWTFPINNEAGLEEEANIEFHQHIFLEHLLEVFPKQGPIRHFMELVTTGLSQNPYLTVERKKDHIEWFRRYFKEKEQILEDSGALSE